MQHCDRAAHCFCRRALRCPLAATAAARRGRPARLRTAQNARKGAPFIRCASSLSFYHASLPLSLPPSLPLCLRLCLPLCLPLSLPLSLRSPSCSPSRSYRLAARSSWAWSPRRRADVTAWPTGRTYSDAEGAERCTRCPDDKNYTIVAVPPRRLPTRLTTAVGYPLVPGRT